MKQFRLDNYQSALLGGSYDRDLKLKTVSAPFLYARGGLFARVVDRPADDCIASGSLKIHNDTGVLQTEMERLNVLPLLSEAVRWTRLYGAAVIIPILDDSPRLEDELNAENITQIRGFELYHAQQITQNSMTKEPTHYIINHQYGSMTVHASRCFFMSGDFLPDELKQYEWQGRDSVSSVYQSILELISAINLAKEILLRKQQPVYKMAGLFEAIVRRMDTEIQQRISYVDAVRGILNTVVIDGGDGQTAVSDEYVIHDLNLSGLPEVVNVFKERVAADSGMPITLLFGRSADGMNATGEGDLRGYYDLVDGIRNGQVKPVLERILALIAAQKSVSGVAENWRIEFLPLYKPTAKEAVENDKIKAETMQIQVNNLIALHEAGVLTDEDVNQWLRKNQFIDSGQAGLDNHEYFDDLSD